MNSGAERRPLLTVVVPAYNEEAQIQVSVAEVIAACEQLNLEFELVIVNDGSTDATAAIADGLAAGDGRIRVVHNPRNLGIGGAYKVGIENAAGTYLFWTPADNSHPREGIIPILSHLGKADIIIPTPQNPQVRPLVRRVISKTFTTLINLLFRCGVPYYNGLVVHRTELLKSIPIHTDGFAFQAEILVKLIRRGCSYVVAPCIISSRGSRQSKALTFRNLVEVMRTIVRLFQRSR